MSAHSLLGASSSHRWLNCPGSFALSRTAPHRPPSIYAATGTLAHEYIERAKTKNFVSFDRYETGRGYSRDGHEITVDDDFIAGVNVMVGYLRERVAHSDWFDVEFRVSLDTYFDDPPPVSVFGTLDAGVYEAKGKTLEIIDYKNGSGVFVSPVENPQLQFYAAGALAYLNRFEIERIKLTICQPHAPGAEPIRSWEIPTIDLLMWVYDTLIPGVMACTQIGAPFNDGPWCRFCPVVHACPKLQADAQQLAKAAFDDFPSGSDLAEKLETAERAELWIDRLREHAVDQLEHQVEIPGWGLVPTRATRKWLLDEHSLVDRLGSIGLDREVVWETRVRSPAALEKELTRTRSGRAIWDAEVRRLIEARSSGVKLGRTDGSAAEAFADE